VGFPFLDQLQRRIRERNLPCARFGLRRREHAVVHSLSHREQASLLVDVLPPQREQLAAAKASVDTSKPAINRQFKTGHF
jgi:hypothetical protein